jgi:hypothetical protein
MSRRIRLAALALSARWTASPLRNLMIIIMRRIHASSACNQRGSSKGRANVQGTSIATALLDGNCRMREEGEAIAGVALQRRAFILTDPALTSALTSDVFPNARPQSFIFAVRNDFAAFALLNYPIGSTRCISPASPLMVLPLILSWW